MSGIGYRVLSRRDFHVWSDERDSFWSFYNHNPLGHYVSPSATHITL